MPSPLIIDSEELLQRFMGNRQDAHEMLECFFRRIPGLIEALQFHIAAADETATLANIQRILSMATCSSALTVLECAARMEHAAKMGDMESLRENLPFLEQKCFETFDAIERNITLTS